MADNSYRSYRRSPLDGEPPPRDGGNDPLAELARIIGQGDPHAARNRNARSAEAYDAQNQSAPGPELDWASAGDGRPEQSQEPKGGYAPRRPAETYRASSASPASWAQDRDVERERHSHPEPPPPPPPPLRQFVKTTASYADQRAEARSDSGRDTRSRSDPGPVVPPVPPMSYIAPGTETYPPGEHDQLAQKGPQYSDAYLPHDYDDHAAPPARRGTTMVLAIIVLAVLGTAAAFGYRSIFGASVLPSLPPIIKADGPIKIEPKHEPQGPASDAAGNGPAEQVVPRQEQPVDLPPASTTPRVITTIPVISNSPNAVVGASSPTAPPSGPGTPSTAVPGPAAAPPPPPRDQLTGPTRPPGTKEVQTLTIRPNQPGPAQPPAPPRPSRVTPSASAPAARPTRPHEVTRDTTYRARRPSPAETASGGPLSIVPRHDEANLSASGGMRVATAPAPRRSPMGSAATGATRPAAGGSYAVQVTSQRSEAEAEASFRSLQGRYPSQLGGRHPIVRRADLGARGVYYRAMVGPFGSAEQAAQFCGGLKAAGGSCVIQRN